MSLQSYDDVNNIRELNDSFKVMTLFWCCLRVRTPARGWQLRRQGLLCLDFPWFLSFKILPKFLESGISFHPTTSDLSHLGGEPSGRPCALCAPLTKLCFSIIIWYCQARVQVPNPLYQQAPNPDHKFRPSLNNPKIQLFGLGLTQ